MSATARAVRPTPHRLGMLFEILGELGEDPTFTYTLARVGSGEPIDRERTHHRETDGYGGLSRFLRARGIGFEAPATRDEPAPGLRERLRG